MRSTQANEKNRESKFNQKSVTKKIGTDDNKKLKDKVFPTTEVLFTEISNQRKCVFSSFRVFLSKHIQLSKIYLRNFFQTVPMTLLCSHDSFDETFYSVPFVIYFQKRVESRRKRNMSHESFSFVLLWMYNFRTTCALSMVVLVVCE